MKVSEGPPLLGIALKITEQEKEEVTALSRLLLPKKNSLKSMLKYLLQPFFPPHFLPREISLCILKKITISAKSPSNCYSCMLAHQVQGESWSRSLREVLQSPSVETRKTQLDRPGEPALEDPALSRKLDYMISRGLFQPQ